MDSEDIYDVLASIEHNPHYLTRYMSFILSCRKHNVNLPTETYFERHHICPKSMWPEYSSFVLNRWNEIKLTGRQHCFAHWILARTFNNRMMWSALKMMFVDYSGTSRYYNSRIYEESKINQSLSLKEYASTYEGKRDYSKRAIKTNETKSSSGAYKHAGEKISMWLNEIDTESGVTNASIKSQNINYDIYRDDLGCSLREYRSKSITGETNPTKRIDVRTKMSHSMKKWCQQNKPTFTGLKHTEKSLSIMKQKKLGESNPCYGTVWVTNGHENKRVSEDAIPEGYYQGRTQKKIEKFESVTCPYCGKEGGGGNMTRYHFDNCKHK